VSYGCIVAPRGIKTPDEIAGMATALPSGAGGFLYLTETATSNQIGLFAINPTTGCLTEATKSPAIIGESGALQSIATWPPRPF